MQCSGSFELVNPQPEEIAAQVRKTAASLGGPAVGGLVFLCGGPARQASVVGQALASLDSLPLLIACGAGVMGERGEHENVSAAVGLLWRGGSCLPFGFDVDHSDGAGIADRISLETRTALGEGSGAVALFAQPDVFPTNAVVCTHPASSSAPLFGGGVVGRPGALFVHRGEVTPHDVVGLAIRGLSPPVVRASTACRLLGELQPVTEAKGALVVRIGANSAIQELRNQARNSERRELLVVAIELGRDQASRPRLLIRGIRGIDEGRGALLVSDEIREGTPVAFAVRDPSASRLELESSLRDMARDMAGGSARFGVYVDCAARGSEMYGVSNVDVDIIRRRFPSLPFIGIKTSFEIGPGRAGPAIHLYTGVLTLFHAPS
jgi:small ligand-binding sensory domain FIST